MTQKAHQLMKERAKGIREHLVQQEATRREFLYEKGELLKIIKKVVQNAFSEQDAVHLFYRDWIVLQAFLEVLTSLKAEVDKRRQRRDLEERVLGTFVLFAKQGRKMLTEKGESFKERNMVHSVM